MISLGAIETALSPLLPEDVEVAATAIPDPKKGERVVLLYAGGIDEQALRQLIGDSELNTLMQPSTYLHVEEIPKLGSGKNDFSAARQLAVAHVEA